MCSIFFSQIVTNVVVQLIVLLYLIDNNENTSWMILAGSGMGVVIEAWKVITLICIFLRTRIAQLFLSFPRSPKRSILA